MLQRKKKSHAATDRGTRDQGRRRCTGAGEGINCRTDQKCMDAELEDDLEYSKYDYRDKETDYSQNGTYKKTVNSIQSDIELEVPRDGNGKFEPQIVKIARWNPILNYSRIFYL